MWKPEVTAGARAMLDDDLEWRLSQIQGFQYGTDEKPISVIRDLLKPYEEQELYRSEIHWSETEHGDLLQLIKMQHRFVAGLAAIPVSEGMLDKVIAGPAFMYPASRAEFSEQFTAALRHLTTQE